MTAAFDKHVACSFKLYAPLYRYIAHVREFCVLESITSFIVNVATVFTRLPAYSSKGYNIHYYNVDHLNH